MSNVCSNHLPTLNYKMCRGLINPKLPDYKLYLLVFKGKYVFFSSQLLRQSFLINLVIHHLHPQAHTRTTHTSPTADSF